MFGILFFVFHDFVEALESPFFTQEVDLGFGGRCFLQKIPLDDLSRIGIPWDSSHHLELFGRIFGRILGSGFKHFLFLPLLGEMIHFDEHIFQRGWFNHHQEYYWENIWDSSHHYLGFITPLFTTIWENITWNFFPFASVRVAKWNEVTDAMVQP